MRTILRVGITLGGVAFVTLFALQSAFALAVAPGIIVAGVFAGLGAAKWLERPWFGRQLAAGLRTGAIACGMAGVGALLALLTQGPHSVNSLAERSHLLQLDFGPLIDKLSGAGWVGVDLLAVALAMAAGITLSAAIAQLGAWSKSLRSIQVVNRARLAAQASLQDNRASISGLFGVSASAGMPPSAGLTGAHPVPAGSGTTLASPTQLPAKPERFQPIEPATPPAASPRQPSSARPADSQLTQAMRDALATWAADTGTTKEAEPQEGGPTPPKARTPQPSNYLNSSPPVPAKRVRKKQDTDWLC
ncbi:MAG: hypothetical protein ACLQUY_01950 [Ktedonobacterales bacterium]